MKILQSALVAVLVAFSANAAARSSVPVIDIGDVAVLTSSGKVIEAEQVRRAILLAASMKNWTLGAPSEGKMTATLHVRAKHTVVVEIAYSAEKYSIRFLNSVNMNQEVREGQTLIHPNYNKWVLELSDSIRRNLFGL